MNTALFIIDPQNDFCSEKGSLYVKGAEKDIERISSFIYSNASKIDSITISLDDHHLIDIAHPFAWADKYLNCPKPFTIITLEDVKSGNWRCTLPQPTWWNTPSNWAEEYLKRLDKNGKQKLCIWPPHCLTGRWGSQIYDGLLQSLTLWEINRQKPISYIRKGANIYTEHYSALHPEVLTVADEVSFENRNLDDIQLADRVIVVGEASSHCVAATTRDLYDFLALEFEDLWLLRDCMSPVPGFEGEEQKLFDEVTKMGCKLLNSQEATKLL